MRFAVCASGRGTNFQALVRAVKKGKLRAECALLVCDNPAAPVLAKAKRASVKVALVERKDFGSKGDFEKRIIEALEAERIDLVVLAGFMRMLSPAFVSRFKQRIINIHPALLPSFKGEGGIADAFAYGVKVTGVTVHFVDEEMDHGPVIAQVAVVVKEGMTADALEKAIHRAEHKLYPYVIQLIADGRVSVEGRRVIISNPSSSPTMLPG